MATKKKKKRDNTQRIRLGRLRKLQFMLENHKAIFGHEGGDNINGKIRFDIDVWASTHQSCGTAACAFGSACYYKPFNRMGLKIVDGVWGNAPEYKGYTEFYAAEEFFKIESLEAEYLFSPDAYNHYNHVAEFFKSKKIEKVTSKSVAARIKKLIAHYEKHKMSVEDYEYEQA